MCNALAQGTRFMMSCVEARMQPPSAFQYLALVPCECNSADHQWVVGMNLLQRGSLLCTSKAFNMLRHA